MSGNALPYLTFARADGERDTYFLPYTTDDERYMRELAPSLHQRLYEYRMANYDEGDIRVLIPAEDLTGRMAQAIHNGRLLGIPVHVVAGITEPMIAHPLKRMDLPE